MNIKHITKISIFATFQQPYSTKSKILLSSTNPATQHIFFYQIFTYFFSISNFGVLVTDSFPTFLKLLMLKLCARISCGISGEKLLST